jgi:hypothetical protein
MLSVAFRLCKIVIQTPSELLVPVLVQKFQDNYHAADSDGNTIDFFLSKTTNQPSAS